MKKSGTTAAAGHAMKNASHSGVRHGPSNKNTHATGNSRGVMGSGMSKGRVAPIKGSDKGGL